MITASSKYVADEISTKLLLSFLECEVLVAVIDGYDFEFSIEAAERKRRTEDSTHMQEIGITDRQKFPKSFQSYLRNSNNKTNLGETTFLKIERNTAESFNLIPNQLFGKP